MTKEEVQYLRDKLKSGEYDGADLMQAWLWLEDLCAERDLYREALEQIRDETAGCSGLLMNVHVTAQVALDPEGCKDLARIKDA